ncbi:helix-turn-helix transcriptional regulator [Streptomyces sp. NBC_00335]|uniref:helix-turn-helix domain-containing protein n=1 Tax=unclassified Streptomyces TaxID=2593676 RepID=UPI0022543E03|nr:MULTISPECIES: helix-turn-helix transcriptional regulator [unclassified Streptomyces]MCX5407447.1 helix-turn-helix transcriptional regulator [Streptomyces sp. NBC_00086]
MKPNGVAIRAIRERSGCGLRELERRTGLTRPFLSRIETGDRGASSSTLQLIATALAVPLKAILKEDT